MRYHLYRFFNFCVGLIPPRVLRQMMNYWHRYPLATDRVGYQVHPQYFGNPFPDPRDVDVEKLKQKRHLPAIPIDETKSMKLLGELGAARGGEVKQFLANRPGNLLKYWNDTYPECDTASLYAMLRHLKPKKYMEVGCGYSSRTSSAALKKNTEEGHDCQCTYIEPYPPAHLAEVKLTGEFIREKVQAVPLAKFQQLEAGDVLFLDTSHVIKTQNDVEFEFLQVLPTLKPGVIVHIHDIFIPYDYPAVWLVGTGTNRGGNNEQYALECLLSGGNQWEIILPVFMLWRDHRSTMDKLAASNDRPAAIWIRKL